MKRLMLLLLTVPILAQGQNAGGDSRAVRELNEITVVADARRTEPSKTVYSPTVRQKSTASDGISLLSRMQIPQLDVNPVAGTIKTSDSQSVSLFVNYRPATDEDVSGLNPKDVKRVEYLDFPADPRFMRAQHVINFITSVYAYGGYTKLNGTENFMIRSGETSLYSKFAYHRMEYDLMLSGNYDCNSHIGSESVDLYRLAVGDITRVGKTESGRYRQRGLYAALRVSWIRSENLTWRNLFSFHRINTPVNDTKGYVGFSSLYPSMDFKSDANATGNEGAWESEIYSSFGGGWAVNGTLRAELRNNRNAMDYQSGNMSILNGAEENFRWFRGDMQINKSLSDRISLFTGASVGTGQTKIIYSGTSDAVNRFRQTFTGLYAGFSMNSSKVSGSIDAGYAFESNYINGKTMTDRYPFTHINFQYAPNQKNSLGLWFQFATLSPDAAMKNPNIIRQSELMYISGNSGLRCSRHFSANVSYTWFPDNNWQMSAYISAFRIISRQIAVYSPTAPDGMMLKKYENDGDYNHGQIGARVTAKFFGGKLSVSFAPRLLLYRTTGSNRISHCPLTASAGCDYYLGNFFFNAYWESKSSYVDGETAYLREMPGTCSVSAGWAAKGWNMQVSFANPFRTSWEISNDTLTTRWFDSTIRQFGADSHRRITLKVTYTINYGKKVKSGNEMNGENGISSSILR